MATIPEISQLIVEETLEWQKPLIHNLVCECVDIEVSLPLINNLLIEWEEDVDETNALFMFGEI